jgi:DNA-binding response OmpR family regulator
MGLDALAELRRDRAFAGTPVVMVAARTQGHDKESALSAGADGFLAKPFSPLKLAALVEEVLAAR